ncbi:hypothetical protein [Bradyrhizobium sp. USDA 4545]|uniref:hypothetical protein n=1 Tax=Bradyrhizobium sp. USDA 4545 TaxID=2817705 RepID=UPI0020A4C40F|nr:hypothetical protein [Bradyrhizobium sp. USDA 4545]MCP1832820.1 hypothetical protein [Bradyrhizobium sp. USDA 4545]
MRNRVRVVAAWVTSTFDARDAVLAFGLVLLAAGLWFVWPPASLIVPGAVLSAVAIFGERVAMRGTED